VLAGPVTCLGSPKFHTHHVCQVGLMSESQSLTGMHCCPPDLNAEQVYIRACVWDRSHLGAGSRLSSVDYDREPPPGEMEAGAAEVGKGSNLTQALLIGRSRDPCRVPPKGRTWDSSHKFGASSFAVLVATTLIPLLHTNQLNIYLKVSAMSRNWYCHQSLKNSA
jgi:hypothetical protein